MILMLAVVVALLVTEIIGMTLSAEELPGEVDF